MVGSLGHRAIKRFGHLAIGSTRIWSSDHLAIGSLKTYFAIADMAATWRDSILLTL
jgi:hypothetical protein